VLLAEKFLKEAGHPGPSDPMRRGRDLKWLWCVNFLLAGLVMVEPVRGDPIIPFTTGSYNRTGLGDQMGTTFDELHIYSSTGSAAVTFGVPQIVPVNPFDFVVGVNAWTPNTDGPYAALRTMTVDGIPGSLTQDFFVDISNTDTLRFLDGPPFTFVVLSGGYQLEVTPLALTLANQPVGTHHGTLYARFLATPIPEPSAIFSFGTCLASLARYFGWRKFKG
jgi:hypothetical protein